MAGEEFTYTPEQLAYTPWAQGIKDLDARVAAFAGDQPHLVRLITADGYDGLGDFEAEITVGKRTKVVKLADHGGDDYDPELGEKEVRREFLERTADELEYIHPEKLFPSSGKKKGGKLKAE